ncbi:hypothetical protein CC78DRAFT_385011 [Lojkania enalia]|uniref:Uncharacterized protein n=1 Tax=Lojkania enalia TaxID=147567 RepID=A0A9P4K4Q5_9PLEO|nr:hypothetical protein CC78DRAFT_385011 [Didymosphaeria enalia]
MRGIIDTLTAAGGVGFATLGACRTAKLLDILLALFKALILTLFSFSEVFVYAELIIAFSSSCLRRKSSSSRIVSWVLFKDTKFASAFS